MSKAQKVVNDDRALLAAIARAFYLDETPLVKIAEMFGISRFKASRLLARARAEQIVTVEVHDTGLHDPLLGQRLSRALGLDACRVVRSHGSEDQVRQQVGAVAADLLSETVVEDEYLGVSWGRTLTATTSQLEWLPRLSIVQLTGVVSGDLESSPITVARQASARSGGAVYPIFAPLINQDFTTAQMMRNHPDISKAVSLFSSITTAVLSVGSWNPPDSQIQASIPPEDREILRGKGCIADIAGVLLTRDGEPASPEFQERCLTLTYDQLRAIPRVIGVAAGPRKIEAIRAVSRAGLISELVTDHTLAGAILAEDTAQ